MAKAVYVLPEMPQSCTECPMCEDYDVSRGLACCRLEADYVQIGDGRCEYCPLKELPPYKPVFDDYDHGTDDYAEGYNAALDEIGGRDG